MLYRLIDEADHITTIETGDSEGNRTSIMAETWNGWTHMYGEGADGQ